jgi:hypothetical protein
LRDEGFGVISGRKVAALVTEIAVEDISHPTAD